MDTVASTYDSDKQREIERLTLGTLINYPDMVQTAAASGLCVDCFRSLPNRTVWAAAQHLLGVGVLPDLSALAAQLLTSGEIVKLAAVDQDAYLVELSRGTPHPSGLGLLVTYLCEVRDNGKARAIVDNWRLGAESLPDLMRRLTELWDGRPTYAAQPTAAARVLALWSSPPPQRIRTGIGELDAKLLGGFMPASLTTLCGGTGRGKTGLIVQIVLNWIQDGWRVLFIETELDDRQLFARFLAQRMARSWASVYSLDVDKREELARLAGLHLPGLDVWIWRKGQSLAAIVGGFLAQHRGERSLVVVDHLGDLARAADLQDMRSAASGVSATLKALALHHHIHVLAISHVARAVTSDPNKARSGRDFEGAAKDAGEIENDSATLLYLHTEPPDRSGTAAAVVHIAKARGAAPNQSLRLRFDGAIGSFSPAPENDLSANDYAVLQQITKLTEGGKVPTGVPPLKKASRLGQDTLTGILESLQGAQYIRRDHTGIHLLNQSEKITC